MSSFSPTHWVIFSIIAAALLYGIWHAIKAAASVTIWWRERAAKKRRNAERL